MNSYLSCLQWLIAATYIGGLIWFCWDMRSILKSGQLKNQLSIDGRWRELNDYFKSAERTRRPFVWLHHRYLLPGNLEAQYALFLYKQGHLEEALAKVDQAIRQNKNKPGIFRSFHSKATFNTLCGALRARALILTGLGRYDEARGVSAELQKLMGPQGKNAALALLEYYCGHLDEALAQAQAVPPGDTQYDAMRGVMANVYCIKGQFQEAIQALSYEPADAFKFYSQSGLETLTKTPEGVELITLKRKRLARSFPPARLVMLARVYVAMEDFEKADHALDEAGKSLGPEPGLQMAYCRQRACSLAGQGRSKEAEDYILRLRAIAREVPRRSALWESHYSIGQSYFSLGRYNDALDELMEARRSVLHPMERHATAYWIAKTHEAVGNQSEANANYQIVVGDAISSRMREQAAAALSRAQT